MITTINPATGKIIQQYQENTTEEVNARIDTLHHHWRTWKNLSFTERGQYFTIIAKKLVERKTTYAQLVQQEMGKNLQSAEAEVQKCALVCEYFAEHAESLCRAESVPAASRATTIYYQPIGIILAIMPWNFPFWQVFRAAATSMMAGNVFLLKHAAISTGAALAIEALFTESVPFPIFHTVILSDADTSALIAHPKIAAVTLTGSVRAGRCVAENAARALKKCVLELGGNDPYIILADANIAEAAKICVQGRLANAGQICIAPKRFIVIDTVYDAFRDAVIKEATAAQATLPPMARHDLRETVHGQVKQSIEQGATLLMGGEMPEGPGFYYPATILDHVKPGIPAFDEELFGPVIALIAAKDEDDAIRLANLSPYGLGAGIFTKDISHGETLARDHLDAGACCINGIVSSDPAVPFGGVKQSGLGYELGRAGIHEFLHIKTVTRG